MTLLPNDKMALRMKFIHTQVHRLHIICGWKETLSLSLIHTLMHKTVTHHTYEQMYTPPPPHTQSDIINIAVWNRLPLKIKRLQFRGAFITATGLCPAPLCRLQNLKMLSLLDLLIVFLSYFDQTNSKTQR